MRLLVCGGRAFGLAPRGAPALAEAQAERERAGLIWILDAEAARAPVVALAHGGAPGADSLAGAWAEARGLEVEVYEADWEAYGRSAGPRRNADMLRLFQPTLVVAFPGGRGTADMARRAEAAGVTVLRVSLDFFKAPPCGPPPVAV